MTNQDNNPQLGGYLVWHFLLVPKRILAITDNFLQFLTNYFSISLLLKTLFCPWRRVIETKTRPGWHPEEALACWLSNFFSSIIGTILRLTVILLWLFSIAQTALLGLIIAAIWLIIPLITLPLYLLEKNQPFQKTASGKKFIQNHSIKQESQKEAAAWFERYWQETNQPFWDKNRLLLIPSPVANWHYGFTPLLDKYSQEMTTGISLEGDKIIGRDKEIEDLLRILSRGTKPAALIYGETGSGRHAIVLELARRLLTNHQTIPEKLRYFRVIKFKTAELFGKASTETQAKSAIETLLKEAKNAGNIILVLDEVHRFTEIFDVFASTLQYGTVKFIGLTTTKQYQKFLLKDELSLKLFEILEIFPLAEEMILRLLENKAGKLERKHATAFPIETLLRIIQLGNQSPGKQPDTSLDLLEEIALIASQKQITIVKPADVNLLAETKMKVPIAALGPEEKNKLINMENLLHNSVINQEDAISEVANALRRARLRLESSNRPLASFLFLGPTGVGKTETAKALAKIYFTNMLSSILRFDMSNFQTKQDATRLINELAKKINEQPYCVLLLDEMEKAHPDLLNIFLTIIDEGYFMDIDGDQVSCRNLFVIGTSNAASEFIRQYISTKQESTSVNGSLPNKVISYVLENNIFSPEFINRFDGVIVFKPLEKPELKQIARIKLDKLNRRLKEQHNFSLEITDELIDQIIQEGYKPEFGAREINRAIQRIVENPLAKKLLEE